jgi:pre-mRNA-splicing factor CDC5/CEF1
MAAAGGEDGANLLQDYSSTPANSLVARTPKAAATADPLLYEAKNIIALNQTNSVLEGGENTPLHQNGGSFAGVTPSRAAVATPNTVLTTPFRGASVGGTPVRGGEASALAATPLRDTLGINSERDSSLLTPRTRNEQMRQSQARADLRAGLSSLPKAAGDYEVVAPELPEDEMDGVEGVVVEDAADLDTRTASEKAAAAAEQLKRRSQPIQRQLPIPRGVKPELLLRPSAATTAEQAADELVKREMLALMRFDEDESTKEPTAFEDDEISEAKEALAAEMEALRVQLGDADLDAKYLRAMDEAQEEVMYVPSKKKFGRASVASKDDKLKLLESQLEATIEAMKKDLKKTLKLEKKQRKLTAGYAIHGGKQSKLVNRTHHAVADSRFQLAAYEKLQARETTVVPTRKAHLQALVDAQEEREAGLQARYAELQEERNLMHAKVQAKRAVATAVSAKATKEA